VFALLLWQPVMTLAALLLGVPFAFLLAAQERWRGVHRPGAHRYTAAHLPARGRRHVPVRTRPDETTVSVDPAVLLRGVVEARRREHLPQHESSSW
jgi:hypothetical protein